MEKIFDIIGIGSPLMDILIQVDEEHLAEFDLKKGIMHLVDDKKIKKILEKYNNKDIKLSPAGDVPNTLMAAATLGANCVLCGKIGKDDHGDIYEEIITKDNVRSSVIKCEKNGTGRCISLITPDAERTFATHLGASITLLKEDIIEEDIITSKFVYVTGYMMETQPELIKHALNIAQKNNTKIAMDLADPALIGRNLENLTDIAKKYADIIFLNEEEVKSLTGKEPDEAINEFGDWNIDIVVVKIGKEGALINDNGKVFKIPAYSVNAVDTTGAGDIFAGGFLYGLSHGKDAKKSAKIATLAASKIVQQFGARFTEEHKESINNNINNGVL